MFGFTRKPLTPYQIEQQARLTRRERGLDAYARHSWRDLPDWGMDDRKAKIAAAAWSSHFSFKGVIAFSWALAITMPVALLWIWVRG
jgi:hypothetical protein